jgi:hypothetical protein
MVMNDAFYRVVLEGALAPRGMPGFQGKLTQQQANDIRAYLARRSFEDFGGN